MRTLCAVAMAAMRRCECADPALPSATAEIGTIEAWGGRARRRPTSPGKRCAHAAALSMLAEITLGSARLQKFIMMTR